MFKTLVFRKLKPKLERATESRLQLITELFGGIQVIKTFVWDSQFGMLIKKARK